VKKDLKSNQAIKCDCGKVVAFEKDGVIYLWCKRCKKEIPLKIEKIEP
jgi:hypothetical protein